ncbi:hypothetical protein, partial [Nonomuraea sp. KM90]|uniref:hypothetical protein n=1 Tax=Nonomuraea sp. KM90 TaxID=3457428 RepID=UPI003FCC3FCD
MRAHERQRVGAGDVERASRAIHRQATTETATVAATSIADGLPLPGRRPDRGRQPYGGKGAGRVRRGFAGLRGRLTDRGRQGVRS